MFVLYIQVLDISILLESILADAKEDAVREAIEEAKSSAIAEFTQEISEQQEESGNGSIENNSYRYVRCIST